MLIVAGKFDEKKALEHIAKYFGSLKKPTRDLPTDLYRRAAAGWRTHRCVAAESARSARSARFTIFRPVPSQDFPACEILEDTLTSEPSGRVYKALVESKKATSVQGIGLCWHDPGAIEITAKVTGDPAKIETARDTLVATIENLHEKPITEQEVERSKQRFKKNIEDELANTNSLAIALSEWAACGDWRLFFIHRDRLEKATAADVNKAASTYLIRSNRTVGIYYPTEKPQRASIPETPDVDKLVKDYKGGAAESAGEAFDPTPENLRKRIEEGTIGDIKTALLVKKTRGDLVHMQLILRFGNEESLKGLTTASSLLGPMLMKGTKNRTRQQITDELDKLSSQLSIGGGPGTLSIGLQTKEANLLPTLKILQEILREPAFPEKEFEVLKRKQVEQVLSQKSEPQGLAVVAIRRKLSSYPKDDVRYVPTMEEMIEAAESVKLDDVKSLYTHQVGAQVGELAIVGSFNPKKTLPAIRDMLKDWKSEVKYARIEKKVSTPKAELEKILTPDKANAVYVAATVGPLNDKDPGHPGRLIGNYLLGGAPLASRLSNRVRGEKGLSYGIGSHYEADALDKDSMFLMFAITNPLNIDKVDGLIKEEVEKFLKNGASLEELEAGKKAYVDSRKAARGEDAALVHEMSAHLHEGRTFEYEGELDKKLMDVTLEDVSKGMKALVDPSKIVTVEAGDFNKKKPEEKKPEEKK